MPHLILYTFLFVVAWALRRDFRQRPGLSPAIWIPTLWAFVICSRPFSVWVGLEGLSNSLDGSPMDRLFFLVLIAGAWLILLHRRTPVIALASRNWPLLLFYGYMLLSVLWSDSTLPSFKRWFKDFGNIPIAMVILTEKNPAEALRAVFVRCAYVLLPLSIIYIRYFPSLGRRYNLHSGQMEAVGVTGQKNSLGVLVLVCGLVIAWDWVETLTRENQTRFTRYAPLVVLAIGIWVLKISDSKTSLVCLLIGIALLLAQKLPLIRTRVRRLVPLTFSIVGLSYLLDSIFGISARLVASLGRDMTLTGRTAVWSELLSLKTDPFFGIGFCSFWDNSRYLSKLSDGIGVSAHNGYLETYLDGGSIAVLLVIILLLATMYRIHRSLIYATAETLFYLAVATITVIGNISESHFGRMTPVWFLFLVITLRTSYLRNIPAGGSPERFATDCVAKPSLNGRRVLS